MRHVRSPPVLSNSQVNEFERTEGTMILEYEKACKEAGLSEEQTKEIRKFFDAEVKKLNRRKTARDHNSVSVFSFEDLKNEQLMDGEEPDFEDTGMNVEELAMKQLLLEKLRDLLQEMPEGDCQFLMDMFNHGSRGEAYIAKTYGWTRSKVRYKKKSLLGDLRKKMGVKKKL